MIPFAVWYEGVPEGSGKWVLAVEKDRLLLVDDEGRLFWKNMTECKFVRVHTPDNPTPVGIVQPQQQVVVPNGGNLSDILRQGF